MAKKLTITNHDTLNEVLTKLTPSWKDSFSKTMVEKAQVTKSSARNYMFGVILNEKFIKLNKPASGFKAGDVVSLADLYEEESANNVTSLIIFRLGNSGFKKPVIVEA